MATLAAYPEWYDRSGNIVPRQDITDVEIVASYNPTGNEVASWDASAALDGSVMAYIAGTKLTLVCDSLTEIPAQTFFHFLSLRSIVGLHPVTIIGERAFCYTPKISSIDIDPAKLASIGAHAFRMSSAEDSLDLSGVSLDIVGDMATRLKRWGAEKLAAIQGIAFPRTICLDVPNSEQQSNYPDVHYGIRDGEVKTVATSGCTGLACYHIWNAINAGTDKEYDNFLDWFNDTLNRNGDWAETYTFSLKGLTDALGWTAREQIYANDGTTALKAILSKLNNGLPVFAQIWSANAPEGQHNICFVGCDATTRKIAVMDSAVYGTTGVLSWLAFEDIYNDGDDTDRVIMVGYNQPVLASGSTWFTQGGVASSTMETITEIDIVDEYTPTGNVTASWDASAEQDDCVMAYIEGTKLTLAGNGYGYIYAHPDSSYAFSAPSNADPFAALTVINGGAVFNTSRAQSLERMFKGCSRMASVDVSKWNTSRVENMKGVFDTTGLTSVDVSKWNTFACKNMTAMFQNSHSLKVLDLANWDVSKVTEMNAMFQSSVSTTPMQLEEIRGIENWNTASVTAMMQVFQRCGSLTKLDLSKWDVSKVPQFNNFFAYCSSLKELNLSGWDTTGATKLATPFKETPNLEKITIGENFDFKEAVLHAPSATYIPYADGNWYDSEYNAYAPTAIPSGVARTYYASKFLAADDDDNMVFIRNGTLRKLAVAIRHKNSKTDGMYPSEFADEVLAL